MSRLPPDSYTARRLEHATPEHLHHTSKRTFVGPIPEGWLKSHRKQWYRQYLPIGKTDSRQNTFIAAQPAPLPERPTQNSASVVPPAQAGQETTPQVNGASVAPPVQPGQETAPHTDGAPKPQSTIASNQPTQSVQTSPRQETPRLSSQSALNNNNAQSTTSLLRSQRTSVDRVESPQLSRTESAGRDSPVLNTRASKGLLFDRARQSVPRVRFDEPSRLQIRARAQKVGCQGTPAKQQN